MLFEKDMYSTPALLGFQCPFVSATDRDVIDIW